MRCTASVTRSISSSNMPRVLGLVSINPATSSSISFSSADTSTIPLASLGILSAW